MSEDLVLGIDTGGTYTDAVLVDHATGGVLAGAKALTTRHDLTIGIGAAISQVFAAAGDGAAPGDVTLVALSTTLATNTLAEGQRGTVCLLLIGYDPNLMQQYGFQRELGTEDVVYLSGGHDELGNPAAPLDEAAAREAILARSGRVEAFAVSGYFGVRNPEHELRVRALVDELAGLPVTCGHELTSRLNAVRRATTAALNAHLILPLRELIASVEKTLAAHEITAPLMVVKGDGSLVLAEWAMRRPIETILSGPAASVVGAWHLAGRRDVWTVDVGGTTTDIAALRDGWPILNAEGASVGGWRTMVEAVDVHTTGLGGDSHVRWGPDGLLLVGPRRVVPLCLLASENPGILAHLHPRKAHHDDAVTFLIPGRQPGGQLSPEDAALLDRLAGGPQPMASFTEEGRIGSLQRRRIEDLEARGLVRRAAFTPTDALHVLGRFRQWEAEASRLGAALLAAHGRMPVEAFCEQVVHLVSQRVAEEIVCKILGDEVGRSTPAPCQEGETAAQALLQRALAGRDGHELGCTLTLRRPLVAIGAPVAAYMPEVADRLNTELVIPPHAEVANAVGAVAGGIIQRAQVLINPLDSEGGVRLHLPDGVHDFESLEPAIDYARQIMGPQVAAAARQAGAEQVVVRMAREDHVAAISGDTGQEIYLGTDLSFTAAGRPSPARKPRSNSAAGGTQAPFQPSQRS